MTSRQTWNFHYTASQLHKAADAKHKHHQSRSAWWSDKKAETITKIRAEGLEVEESIANLVSNSYHRGATVNVRADLMRDLQECVDKIREHSGKGADYAGWMQVLGSQGELQLPLDHDDWMFFFGRASAQHAGSLLGRTRQEVGIGDLLFAAYPLAASS